MIRKCEKKKRRVIFILNVAMRWRALAVNNMINFSGIQINKVGTIKPHLNIDFSYFYNSKIFLNIP